MEKKTIEELLKLPEYEAEFSPFDMIEVNDFIASHTIKMKFWDDEDKIMRDAEKCDVSQERIALHGLGIGLKSLGGDKIEDNLQELIIKHLKLLPTDIIRLYNDMTINSLKKKSEQS